MRMGLEQLLRKVRGLAFGLDSFPRSILGITNMWAKIAGFTSLVPAFRLEQAGDLVIPRLGSMLTESRAMGVLGSSQRWQASEKPTHPSHVILTDGIEDIFDLHGQQSAALTEVLNRPARGGGMEPIIPRIDVGAAGEKQTDDLPMAVQSCVVQRGRSFVVFHVDDGWIQSQELAHSFCASRLDSRKQLLTHGRLISPAELVRR
jgi:hypothetical protein